MACLRYTEDFGRREVYQLPFAVDKQGRHEAVPQEHRGRFLFGEDWTFAAIRDFAGPKPKIRKTKLTAEFNYEEFLAQHGDNLLPMMLMKPDGTFRLWTVNETLVPKPGDMDFSLVRGK